MSFFQTAQGHALCKLFYANKRGPDATYIPPAYIVLTLGLLSLTLGQGGLHVGSVGTERPQALQGLLRMSKITNHGRPLWS